MHRSHVNERDTLVINLEDTQKEIEEAEKNCSILEERFKFFQEMRGYVRDLVECLNEKVGLHILKNTVFNPKSVDVISKKKKKNF